MADWEVIAQGEVTGSTTSDIDFNSIPGTYQHLELSLSGRVEATNWQTLYIRFNSNTGQLGYSRFASTQASSGTVTQGFGWSNSTTYAECGHVAGNNFSTGAFGNVTMIIPNYADSTVPKTVLSRCAGGSGGFVDGQASAFSLAVTDGGSTMPAITQISLAPYPFGGTTYWTAGSSYMLAGYRG